MSLWASWRNSCTQHQRSQGSAPGGRATLVRERRAWSIAKRQVRDCPAAGPPLFKVSPCKQREAHDATAKTATSDASMNPSRCCSCGWFIFELETNLLQARERRFTVLLLDLLGQTRRKADRIDLFIGFWDYHD